MMRRCFGVTRMRQCFGVSRPHQAVRRTEGSGCRQLMCVSKVVQDDEALLRCEPSTPSSAAYRHRDQRLPATRVRVPYRIHSGGGRNCSFGESSAYPRWSETVKQCFCPGAVIHTRSVLGIVNFSGTLRWVDITVLIKIFQSPDDIARPRGKVFDDDHPLAYITRGEFVGIG